MDWGLLIIAGSVCLVGLLAQSILALAGAGPRVVMRALIALILVCIATILLAILLFDAGPAGAASIPRAALQHRADLIRAARVSWGLDAPVAVFAAQIHQESCWNAGAESRAGAQGLAQVMPSTAAWLPQVAPHVGQSAPWNPGWALRALTAYDRWLWERVDGFDTCARMAKTLSAYNGGLGWVRRDERLAAGQGLDPARWWGHVETVNAGRSAANYRENRAYPRRILLVLQPVYRAWGPGIDCEVRP